MEDKWLYEKYDNVVELGYLPMEVPLFISNNINPRLELRPYQIEAFARFIEYLNKDKSKKPPIHLLFNMATGSGKTLIMAGLILYLFEKGYRNFLFFVNSTNIIEKTKDNFLNPKSSKYLFNDQIIINNNRVSIQQVDNFESASKDNINIVFTTIQGLHSDLYQEKENALTFDDFKNKEIVLLSDEAHHTNVQTRSGQKGLSEALEKPNWENTVERIVNANSKNILLEFTATLDFMDWGIEQKYKSKILYKYDLREFRNDGFSKDVNILQADMEEKERILQALVLNQYRQEVASKHKLNVKPVILFKAQKTILQSQENKEKFHRLVEDLNESQLQKLQKETDADIIKQAFTFFKENSISLSDLVKKLKINFAENKCLSVNDESEKEKYQLLVNSLEDKDNQIRALFAVQKLNEGWDVLNLFDIVRLYDTRDSDNGQPGKTTIAEAQLIGRGARYYPFAYEGLYTHKRKFDYDLNHELRILEELHYHSVYDSRYIAEIRQALEKEGMIDSEEKEVQLSLKEAFKESKFYNNGLIYLNKQIKNDFGKVRSFQDIGVTKKNVSYTIKSGTSREEEIFTDKNTIQADRKVSRDVYIDDLPYPLILKAIAKHGFFTFERIQHYFPYVTSTRQFIESDEYLGGVAISIKGLQEQLDALDHHELLNAVLEVLYQIEIELKTNVNELKGSEEFEPEDIKRLFYDTKLKVKKNTEREDGQMSFVMDANRTWYAYNANYGTSEEKAFVEMFDRQVEELKKSYTDIYLIRNEKQFKIYNFEDGRAFQPDFVLFMKEKKTGEPLTYQLFIEPKGKHLADGDRWKEELLLEIRERYKDKVLKLGENKRYRILGVPFYNNADENEFKRELYGSLS